MKDHYKFKKEISDLLSEPGGEDVHDNSRYDQLFFLKVRKSPLPEKEIHSLSLLSALGVFNVGNFELYTLSRPDDFVYSQGNNLLYIAQETLNEMRTLVTVTAHRACRQQEFKINGLDYFTKFRLRSDRKNITKIEQFMYPCYYCSIRWKFIPSDETF